MQWLKESVDEKDKHYDLLTGLIILLTIIGLYLDRQLVFLFIGLLGVYLVGIHYYNHQVGKGIVLENPEVLARSFAGEDTQFNLTITNHSRIPYLNGKLSFEMNNQIISEQYLQATKKDYSLYHVPFSLPSKSKVTVTIPLKVAKRGVGRLNKIEYSFPHLLLFQPIVLKFKERFRTEFLVYPELQPIANIESNQNQHIGEDTALFSPYEDLLRPVGTRNYVQSDPFQRIHWKASAHSQKLQTKIYERNQQISWTIIVNIAKKSPLGNYATNADLEEILSEAAYLSRWITKQDQPVELYINGSVMTKYLHLEEDQGLRHMKRILELLARVETGSRIYPVENLLHHVQKFHHEPRKIVMTGELDELFSPRLNKLLEGRHQVYHVEKSCLTPITLKGKQRNGA